ncbi:hypothetical protein OSTOST_25187 [Ostertagia ostertagi]
MFQTPIVPELTVKNRDFHMFDVMLRGKKAGIRNAQNFTDEDLEAWKHPPTLIIWGDEDQFLVKEGAIASLKYCRHGQLKFIEGCITLGHAGRAVSG